MENYINYRLGRNRSISDFLLTEFFLQAVILVLACAVDCRWGDEAKERDKKWRDSPCIMGVRVMRWNQGPL
jgi:hypothetical protein